VPVAARLQTAGCVALVALLLAGCGGGGSSAAESTAAAVTSDAVTTVPQRPVPKHEKPAAGPCQIQLGSFVASMDSLRRRLAVGLSYDQYVAEVRGIRSTYKKIPIERVEINCLSAVGTPAEQAFNRYIEAANDWGKCVSEAGCSPETVEPVLQRGWRIASHFLSEADEGLNASAP
jgi:hypothetical protein